jgi:hypothetical protein
MSDGNMPPDDYVPNGYGQFRIQTSRGDSAERTHEHGHKRAMRGELIARDKMKDRGDYDDIPRPKFWTPEHVGSRLILAFKMLRLHAAPGPKRSPGNGLPAIVRDADDLSGMTMDDRYAEAIRNQIPLRSEEIRKMDLALGWLDEMRQEHPITTLQTMYWADSMAAGKPLAALCARKKWSNGTFYKNVGRGKKMITERLRANGEGVF